MRTGKLPPRYPYPPEPQELTAEAEPADNSTRYYAPEELRQFLLKLKGDTPQGTLRKQLAKAKTVTLLGKGKVGDTTLTGPEFTSILEAIGIDKIPNSAPEAAAATEILMTLAPGGFKVVTQEGEAVRFETKDFLRVGYSKFVNLDNIKFSATDPAWIARMRAQLEKYKSTSAPDRIDVRHIHWYKVLGKFFARRAGVQGEDDEFRKFLKAEEQFRRAHLRLNLKAIPYVTIRNVRAEFWRRTLQKYDAEPALSPKEFVAKYQPQKPLGDAITPEQFLRAFLLKLEETNRPLRTELDPIDDSATGASQ